LSEITTALPAGGRGRLFNNADFWRLWYAGLIVFLIRWVETLAVAVFVFQRTNSPFLVAMMTMLRLLPMGLFGAFIGAGAERVQRRTGLLIVILMMGTASGTLAALAWTGGLAVWHLALGSFVNGIGWATDNPVRRAALGEVVGSDRMGTAMSLDVAANNGSRMLGPAIGGIVLATGGLSGVFALSVVLYATALLVLLRLQRRPTSAKASSAPVLSRIAEGLAAARKDPRLVGTLTITVIYNVFAWPFTSMVPVIAEGWLHLGDTATGELASLDGVGAFFGAIGIALLIRRRHYAAAYVGGMLIYQVMLILFAIAPDAFFAGSALFVEGVGSSGFSIMQATLVYLFSPAEMRSRMLGVLSACIGLGPIGFIHLGLLADWIGARGATVVTGIEGLVAMALTWRLWRAI
jgi:MFS family permease